MWQGPFRFVEELLPEEGVRGGWPWGRGTREAPREAPQGAWYLGESCVGRALRARGPAGRLERRREPSASAAAVPRKRVGAQGRGGGRGMGSEALGAPRHLPHLRLQDWPSLCFRWLRRTGEGSEGCRSQDGLRDHG